MTSKKRPIILCFIFALSTIFISVVLSPLFISVVGGSESNAILLSQTIGYAIPLLVLLYLTTGKDESLFLRNDKGQTDKKTILITVIESILIFMIIFLFSIILRLFMAKMGLVSVEEKRAFSFWPFCLGVIIYAVLPAILEEYIYKGVYSKCGLNKVERYIFIVFLFTLSHRNFIPIVSAFLFSNLSFFLYERRRNIREMVLLHLLYNVYSLIFSNYIRFPFELSSLVNDVAYMFKLDGIIFILTGVIVIVFGLFIILQSSMRKEKIHDEKPIEKKDKKHFCFLTLFILVYLLYFFVNNLFTIIF